MNALSATAAPSASARVTVTVGAGDVFYVSTTGSDNNPGTESRPFRHIGRVVNNNFGLKPGDTVIVMPGTYTEQIWASEGGDGSGPVPWTAPTSVGSGYVTIRSQVKHQALLRPPSGTYSTFNIAANYFCIDGFDVVGGSGHAIQCEGSRHHVKIINNICHDSGGSGVSCAWGEFYLIERNVCRNNSATNGYQTSGISIYQARNSSGDTSYQGFRNIVRCNISYNNLIQFSGSHTDGNGIIIDDFQHTQTNGFPIYRYRTLVDSNLCYHNGGGGVHLTWSNNVTICNNTCYGNYRDTQNPATWRAELSNMFSDNNTWVNNIGWARPGAGVLANNVAIGDRDNAGGNANVVWHNNMTFNGTPGQTSVRVDGSNGSLSTSQPYNNRFGVNPGFTNPGTGTTADFRLQAGSPALQAGTSAFGLGATDLDGRPRLVGAAVDIGCYER
jgi:hypothetical protein